MVLGLNVMSDTHLGPFYILGMYSVMSDKLSLV